MIVNQRLPEGSLDVGHCFGRPWIIAVKSITQDNIEINACPAVKNGLISMESGVGTGSSQIMPNRLGAKCRITHHARCPGW